MEWAVVAVVAVAVLFGVNKIPDIARNIGRAQSEFKKGLKEGVQPESDASDRAEQAKPAEPKPDAEA